MLIISKCIVRYSCHPRHFGSYKPGKLRGAQHKGRHSVVKSSQLSWAGQYKKCVQYDFKLLQSTYATINTKRLHRLHATCYMLQAIIRLQVTCYMLQATGYNRLQPGCMLHATSYNRLHVTCCMLQAVIANRLHVTC